MRTDQPSDPARLTVVIERMLHDEFKIACIANGTTMTAVLEHFIEEYVESQRAGRAY
jgi:hypothetical protein